MKLPKIKLSEILMLGTIIFLGWFITIHKCKIVEHQVFIKRDSLTKENVAYWIKVARVKHDSIVLKQAILESGNLKCDSCSLDKNNLFGFHNGKRYLEFNTWIESIFYYAWWQEKNYKGGDYYNFLDSIKFASDKNYINNLKQIK